MITVDLSNSDINRLVSILSEYQMQTGKDVEDLLETFREKKQEPEEVYSTPTRPPDESGETDDNESSWE
ncbi:hypothetical protein SAMN05421858_4041 [Haladaptatus litoreus]|uniref:Uncharacterized protein n=1 Tax=Haladaptatus litoreus TaxID=553468 RepID=A0A1N7E5T6_9EURY|nr:hypothetical protein [Haladaptatus litoreus]SIR83368.1 hypothetical protein SAMN05421858_4041 [Haladaptatus litoreus]